MFVHGAKIAFHQVGRRQKRFSVLHVAASSCNKRGNITNKTHANCKRDRSGKCLQQQVAWTCMSRIIPHHCQADDNKSQEKKSQHHNKNSIEEPQLNKIRKNQPFGAIWCHPLRPLWWLRLTVWPKLKRHWMPVLQVRCSRCIPHPWCSSHGCISWLRICRRYWKVAGHWHTARCPTVTRWSWLILSRSLQLGAVYNVYS